ncbi:Accessory gene regulator protein B [Eubacterium plexicaudatum ASF492]|nr:Accessory gene regulator protein B [Eubacterium plexicaudatum ASF492]
MQKGMLDDKEHRLYVYAYNLLICRTIVYLLIVVFGICMGSLKEMIVFLLAFVPLRQYAGGIHLEKAEKCIVASGILICISGQYLKYFPIPTVSTFLWWIVSVGVISMIAPVECSNKKLESVERKVYKKRSWVLLGIESLSILITLLMDYLWISKSIMVSQVIISMSLILGILKENFLV